MPGNLALVDYDRCDPAACKDGVCLAVVACPRKLLIQEEPYDAPMTSPATCRGCADCVRACPLQAIRLSPG